MSSYLRGLRMVGYIQIKGKPDRHKNVLPRKRFRKEVETMRTRTENDVRKFNEALDRCRRPVFLVSADGTQYNMKSANDYYAGMGRWINDSRDEMEIFTSCFEDAGVMMDFCLKMSA